MKNLHQIVPFLLLILFSVGCSKNSTELETPVELNDQIFSLVENSRAGTVVGQIKYKNSTSNALRFYLVSGEYSNAFELNATNGTLVLKDSSLIDFETIQQILLQIMVGYRANSEDYGVLANVIIEIENVLEPFTLLINDASGKYQEATVQSLFPDTQPGQTNYIVANAWTNNLDTTITRSLIQFDLAAIPMNAQLISAKISLYNPNEANTDHQHSTFSGSNSFYFRKVTAAWDYRTVTWNNQPGSSTENQIFFQQSENVNQDYEGVDMLALVQQAINNPDEYFGFMLMLENEEYYRQICFASMKYPDENFRPRLEISYFK